MKLRDVFHFAFDAILRGKSRVILTVLAVSIGVCSIVLITTLSENGIKAVNHELDKIGFESVSVFGSNEESKLYPEDVSSIKRIAEAEDASPMVIVYGGCRLRKQYNQVLFLGVDANVASVLNLTVLHGRLPNENDVRSGHTCAVVDSNFAKKHYKRENIIGKKLIAQIDDLNVELEIIGIVSPQKDVLDQMLGGVIPEFIYLPYTTLNQIRGRQDVTQIALKGNISSKTAEIEKKLDNFFSKHKSGSFNVENIGGYVDGFRSITLLIGLVISAIAGISLCVAGIGIMNSMLSSVNERKREIGICMAIGATRGDIVRCFLTEGILTTLFGSLLGFSFAAIVIKFSGQLFDTRFTLNYNLILMIIIVAVIFGTLFSIVPAIRASRLDPIETLRSEL